MLRYFFCANSLAASAAREKSKIDAAGTSPFKLAVEATFDRLCAPLLYFPSLQLFENRAPL
jgi:hypothetical protein